MHKRVVIVLECENEADHLFPTTCAQVRLSFYWGVRACGYMLDIRIDDLDPIAEATFKHCLPDVHDAVLQGLLATWQGLSVKTCPRDDLPKLCTYNACFARPASTHCTIILRLALSNKCMQGLLRSSLGCHNLPWAMSGRTALPGSQRFCYVRNTVSQQWHLCAER